MWSSCSLPKGFTVGGGGTGRYYDLESRALQQWSQILTSSGGDGVQAINNVFILMIFHINCILILAKDYYKLFRCVY